VASNKQQIKSNKSETTGKKSKKQPENSEMNSPKRVRIRPKYNTTTAFSKQEDKEATNKQTCCTTFTLMNPS